MTKSTAKLKERILQDLEILQEELNYADKSVDLAIKALTEGISEEDIMGTQYSNKELNEILKTEGFKADIPVEESNDDTAIQECEIPQSWELEGEEL